MGNVRLGRIINAALLKKSFFKKTDGDHVVFCYMDENRNATSIKTKISHGMLGKTIGSELISKMARQCHLTKQQFLDLVDCRLSEEAYREILRQHGFDV